MYKKFMFGLISVSLAIGSDLKNNTQLMTAKPPKKPVSVDPLQKAAYEWYQEIVERNLTNYTPAAASARQKKVDALIPITAEHLGTVHRLNTYEFFAHIRSSRNPEQSQGTISANYFPHRNQYYCTIAYQKPNGQYLYGEIKPEWFFTLVGKYHEQELEKQLRNLELQKLIEKRAPVPETKVTEQPNAVAKPKPTTTDLHTKARVVSAKKHYPYPHPLRARHDIAHRC